MLRRSKTVLKVNKTTKSLKLTLNDSHYHIIYNMQNNSYSLSFASRRYFTSRIEITNGWEINADPKIPMDLIYDMVDFLNKNNEPFIQDSLKTFCAASSEKYNSELYTLDAIVIRISSKSPYIHIGRGGTYSDSSFCINRVDDTIYRTGGHNTNSLDGTIIPFFEYYDANNVSTEMLDEIEVQNFQCSLLPTYEIYRELRAFMEKVKNDETQSYAWEFKTFLPYGDI